ncbi:MAG: N-acyl homoserine lactonase family protein [Anaerolineae bacterium]|nr:N-acyl homoserine lactonase family protein [Anaerolineae bacterium]
MSVANTRIYPINTGWAEADLGTYIFFKGPGGQKTEIPMICFYVDTGEHKIMVDTGIPDAERATRYHHKTRKGDCLDSPDALLKMGVNPDEIDICIFTHLHWDHVSCMKRFRNARYIVSAAELQWAYNPLPLYYRSYESPVLGIEAPFVGCNFEVVEGEATIVPGVKVFPTPGHTPGHQSVEVQTEAGTIVLVGDAIFTYRNFEPNMEEHWRYWVQQRFVSMIDGWRSTEEIDRRADFILPCHDAKVMEHPVYPYPGMPLRKRREPIPGAPFYFAGI